jgi:hypothetical protein
MTLSLWKTLLLLFLPFTTMANSFPVDISQTVPVEPMFAGSWKLSEVFDDRMAPINLPGDSFLMSLQPTKDYWRSGTYDMSLALGNRLGGRITVAVPMESDGLSPLKRRIRIGPVRSTMMMPEESVFLLEVAMTDILPEMSTIELVTNEEDGTALLVLEGPKGKLVCEKVN